MRASMTGVGPNGGLQSYSPPAIYSFALQSLDGALPPSLRCSALISLLHSAHIHRRACLRRWHLACDA